MTPLNNHKINGFTIIEVVITMILTVLIISVTYTAFEIIRRSYTAFDKKNEEIQSANRLNFILEKDLAEADSLHKIDSGFMLSGLHKFIKYTWNSNRIVRHDIVNDTFKIKIIKFNAYFDTDSLSGLNTDRNDSLINTINTVVLLNGKILTCHYYKLYSSVDLFNDYTHAFN